MARRNGGTHKGVEEKRRSLPIYQHYTLSPGKTKSHHPEAKCNHCLKEFVCGSKQRLIRHLRKCNSISNPEQIIAETLNTLARNSATGTLNHSILEASNLLPSQISNHLQNPVVTHLQHQQQQQLISHQIQHHHSSTANNISINNSSTINANSNNNSSIGSNNFSNHNTSGSSCNDTVLMASSSNGSVQPTISSPNKRPQRRGRRSNNTSLANNGPGIHVTTGVDGKTHFTPASKFPSNMTGTLGSPMITQVHNGRPIGLTYHQSSISTSPAGAPVTGTGSHPNSNPAHLTCATQNHLSGSFKLNSEPIDRAYLKLVLTRNLPISLCDTKEFQSWVKTFAIDYKPPSSSHLITLNLKNEAQAARQKISNIIAKAPKKTINLELHSWPSGTREHLWYATVANLDHKRFLISVRDIYSQDHSNNDQLHQTGHSQLDRTLAMFIDDCVKRVGSDRINSLVFSDTSEEDALKIQSRQYLKNTHSSIITYTCWWHYTNLLCSDIIERNHTFQNVLRNSNRLINFIGKWPRAFQNLEKFSPFASIMDVTNIRKNDRKWYSHIVCYLLEYVKYNIDAIHEALEAYSITGIHSHLSSDNNNNSSPVDSSYATVISQNTDQTTQEEAIHLFQDSCYPEIRSTASSPVFKEDLSLLLATLKPIHDIVALTRIPNPGQSSSMTNNSTNPTELNMVSSQTSPISPIVANSIALSEYMEWFLFYGKTLIESWHRSPDEYKFHLVVAYLTRFSSSLADFKLLFAAYLLNPKHRCAFMTQQAKDTAIEEILNIASEFISEESAGRTIFEQWKLYLVREEPYDVVYEESRTTPLEWWMSLPCAESIRRVALRILRLKAFTSPKPESLFSQLYFYQDELRTSLTPSSFEDVAILRYFYDHEDKIGQIQPSCLNSSGLGNFNANQSNLNGYYDRTQVGQVHNQFLNESNNPVNYLPTCSFDNRQQSNEQMSNSMSMSDSLSDVIVEPSYMNHHNNMNLGAQQIALEPSSNPTLESHPDYRVFVQYVDFNDCGVQLVVEEPIEKKKRKWTAQEILSKCQVNNTNHNNNNQNK